MKIIAKVFLGCLPLAEFEISPSFGLSHPNYPGTKKSDGGRVKDKSADRIKKQNFLHRGHCLC